MLYRYRGRRYLVWLTMLHWSRGGCCFVDAVAVAGTPEEVVPKLQELVDLGVQGFVFPFAQPEPIPYMETFAREVMPKIKG